MKTKNKIIIITLLAIYALIGSYIFITQIESVNPPEPFEYSVIIDLEKPDGGTITFIVPHGEIATQTDREILSRFGAIGNDILEDQYLLIKSPANEITQKDSEGHIQIEFIAENKYEFAWPVCTFNSTFLSFYQVADFTVILPEGYEIVDIATENAVKKPKRRFVDDRWEIETKTLENSEFQIEITYKKEE